MAGLADFHRDAPGEFSGQAQPGTEDFQDERIARADQFHAAAHAHAERLEALGILVVRLDAAHDGADARWQLIKPHRGGWLFNSCHNDDKISFPLRKSNPHRAVVDAAILNCDLRRIAAKAGGTRRQVGTTRAPLYRRWRGGADVKFVEMRRRLRQAGRVKLLRFLPLVLAAIFAGCAKSSPPAAGGAPSLDDLLPKQAQPKLRTMKIYLGAETLAAELALTQEEEMTGMMFRTNILETDAMLFRLPVPQRASFWMKNCPESISAAYITADGVIQEIHHLEKNDTNSVVAARDDIQFVLETKEGWFTRHNISPGTVIQSGKGPLADVLLRRQ